MNFTAPVGFDIFTGAISSQTPCFSPYLRVLIATFDYVRLCDYNLIFGSRKQAECFTFSVELSIHLLVINCHLSPISFLSPVLSVKVSLHLP